MKMITTDPRRRALAILTGVALVSVAAALISVQPTSTRAPRDEVGESVAPDFRERIDELGLIMVTTAHDSYHLVRNPDGWVLTEKGQYPVADERIAELAESISTMTYAEAMTRDDRKFDLLGLGDPLSGGTGALLELGNGRGDVFAKLIVGYKSGESYIRWPGDLQTWAVEVAAMPPLHRPASWLDLDPVDLDRAEINRVTVRPSVGQPYSLTPLAETSDQFRLAPPNDDLRVLVPFSLTLVGGALANLNPVDVAPLASLDEPIRSGLHTTELANGVEVELTAWRTAERGWVTIEARVRPGASSEAAARAASINHAADGWAYAITEADWEAFASPLALFAVEE